MRNLIIAVCMVMLVGCTDSAKVIPDAKYAQTRLSADGIDYIALPADGSHCGIPWLRFIRRNADPATLQHLSIRSSLRVNT